ncbi:MAG TPA: xanthine dehydrogenase family protein molybdopterin-binding subunit [Dehalococcoidia bacterium]|nr:xanthine dehydrogenase family protein molybdopterin-binding subunit [Dehalococcoidia bacterium]
MVTTPRLGKQIPLVDGDAKVSGTALYAADVKRPNMLQAKVFRSKVPHALIKRLDVSRAKQLPGVQAIITAADFPAGHLDGTVMKDKPVIAVDRVRHIGEAIAVVAAETEEIAEEALGLIELELEELPAVLTPEEAMKADAPILHPDLDKYEIAYNPIRYGNVCSEVRMKRGDVEEAFAKADIIHEKTYTTQRIHQGYLEPHATIAEMDNAGRVTVWSSTQRPFGVRDDVAHSLHLPVNKVHVITTYVGGGFGGKEEADIEVYCAALARKSGRAVRLVESRGEDMIANTSRHSAVIHMKSGVMKDGTVIARKVDATFDSGAYCHTAPVVTGKACNYAIGPYKIPNVDVVSRAVYTNTLPAASMRGTGAPQTAFAHESHMDEIAEILGLDPLEYRKAQTVDEGYVWPNGQALDMVAGPDVLDAIKPYWEEAKQRVRPGYGVGMSYIMHQTGVFPSSADVEVTEDGTVTVRSGAVDLGTGSKTSLAQIVAEDLGLPMEDVTVIMADTDTTPFDILTAGSRVGRMVSAAVANATKDVKQQLLERAAHKLESVPDALDMSDGRIFLKDSPETSISIAELGREAVRMQQKPIDARGHAFPPMIQWDRNSVQGSFSTTMTIPAMAALVAEVSIDEVTGEVTPQRIVMVQDVGFALNPMIAEGQIEGAIAQGLGNALYEEMIQRDGRIANANLLDYRMPTTRDAPELKVVLVESLKEQGPYGAKGIGEISLGAVMPAVGNAVKSATGLRVRDLPITPERILLAQGEA